MPDLIVILCGLSALLALPALGVAMFHGLRMEKHIHCARDAPCEKGTPPS